MPVAMIPVLAVPVVAVAAAVVLSWEVHLVVASAVQVVAVVAAEEARAVPSVVPAASRGRV